MDSTSPFALTGAIFSRDRQVIDQYSRELKYSAGNFYINDKPTGAVVGQQPFGGSRLSGTNDKAGSELNLLRWCSLEQSRRPSYRLVAIFMPTCKKIRVERRLDLLRELLP